MATIRAALSVSSATASTPKNMNAKNIVNFFNTVTDCKLAIYDQFFMFEQTGEIEPNAPYGLEITGPHGFSQRIEWKTPAKEDNFPRSLVTCFCSKYRIINPALMWRCPPPDECERNAANWHRSFCYTKEQIRQNLSERFHSMPFSQRFFNLLCPTLYGIGVWVVFGARQDLIDKVSDALTAAGVSFENEWSDKLWVYRFRTGLNRTVNESLIATLNA